MKNYSLDFYNLIFFSQLLLKPKFSGVEKIKTIGSTYMAAAGLSVTPGQENNQVCYRFRKHLEFHVSLSESGQYK